MCKARITAADITKLCDEWCSAAAGAGGGTVVGPSTRKFELLENGVVFPDLDHDALCAAVVCLSKVLHRPGHGTVRNPDHFWLWSWCGELLLRSPAQQQLFTVDQVDQLGIKILCQTCVYAALVGWGDAQGVTTPLFLKVPQAHYGLGFLQQSHAALAYLAFPLLDAVLKRACPSYVAMDGTVVQAFTRAPDKKEYNVGNRCSSLRDMLLLHHDWVAVPDLRALLDRFNDHIAPSGRPQDAYDRIFGWRNGLLHGEKQFLPVGGTVLNLALLILLFEIRQEFERYRSHSAQRAAMLAKGWQRQFGDFYPPP